MEIEYAKLSQTQITNPMCSQMEEALPFGRWEKSIRD